MTEKLGQIQWNETQFECELSEFELPGFCGSFLRIFLNQVKMKYSMDGYVSGHSFTVVGDGTSNPYE